VNSLQKYKDLTEVLSMSHKSNQISEIITFEWQYESSDIVIYYMNLSFGTIVCLCLFTSKARETWNDH